MTPKTRFITRNYALVFSICATTFGAAHAQDLPAPANAPEQKAPAKTSETAAPAEAPARSTSTTPTAPEAKRGGAPALPPPASGAQTRDDNNDPTLIEGDSAPPSGDDGVQILPPQNPNPTDNPIAKTPPVALPVKKISRTVGGVQIAGLDNIEALQKLQDAHDGRLQQPIVLRLGKREWWRTRAELGVSISYEAMLKAAKEVPPGKNGVDVKIPLRFTLDRAQALDALNEIAPDVLKEVKSTGVVNNRTTGTDGEELNIGGSIVRLTQGIEGEPSGLQIDLMTRRVPFVPQIIQPKIEGPSSGDARFPVLLANFSTKYNPRLEARSENLRIAAREINGTIVENGAVFSTNQAIGRRDTSRGFRPAHIFMGKKVVEGVGGGICQSATTVYNAALEAKLQIVERHSHSLPVSYAPSSRDATIYWGSKDMRFRNNTGTPILIKTFLRDNRFHTQIFGSK